MNYHELNDRFALLVDKYIEITGENRESPKDVNNWAFITSLENAVQCTLKYVEKQQSQHSNKGPYHPSINDIKKIEKHIEQKFGSKENEYIKRLFDSYIEQCGGNKQTNKDFLYFVLYAIDLNFERGELITKISDWSAYFKVKLMLNQVEDMFIHLQELSKRKKISEQEKKGQAYAIIDERNKIENKILGYLRFHLSVFAFVDDNNMNIAMHAARLGFERVTRLGLEKNIEAAFQRDKHGNNIIFYAYKAGMEQAKETIKDYKTVMSCIEEYRNYKEQQGKNDEYREKFDEGIFSICELNPLVFTLFNKEGKNIRECLTGLGFKKTKKLANKYAIYEKNNKFQNQNRYNEKDIDRTNM